MTLDERLDAIAERGAFLADQYITPAGVRELLDEAITAYQEAGLPPERIAAGLDEDNQHARARITPDRPPREPTTPRGGIRFPVRGGEPPLPLSSPADADEDPNHFPASYGTAAAWDALLIARSVGMSVGLNLLAEVGLRPLTDSGAGLALRTDERVHRVRVNNPLYAPQGTIVSYCQRTWPAIAPWSSDLTPWVREHAQDPRRCDTCTPDSGPTQG